MDRKIRYSVPKNLKSIICLEANHKKTPHFFLVKENNQRLLIGNFDKFLKRVLLQQSLMAGNLLSICPLNTIVNYSNVNWDIDSIMHFLVLQGYLTYSKQACSNFGDVWIPNQVVKTVEFRYSHFTKLDFTLSCEFPSRKLKRGLFS